MKIRTLLKSIDKVFVKPKISFYLGKLHYGTPYFYPRNFNKNIISIHRLQKRTDEELLKVNKYVNDKERIYKLPMVRRSKYWIIEIFRCAYFIAIGWPIKFVTINLGWKDKFGSPRYEWSPSFQIYFFHWQFCVFWNAPDGDNDLYYEMVIWYLNYSKKDIHVARNTWGWMNGEILESTWNDNYLIDKI